MKTKKYVLEVSSVIDRPELSYQDMQMIIRLLTKYSSSDLMYELYTLEDEGKNIDEENE